MNDNQKFINTLSIDHLLNNTSDNIIPFVDSDPVSENQLLSNGKRPSHHNIKNDDNAIIDVHCVKNNEGRRTNNTSAIQSNVPESPGPLVNLPAKLMRNLRRNSISLPTGLNTMDSEAVQNSSEPPQIGFINNSKFEVSSSTPDPVPIEHRDRNGRESFNEEEEDDEEEEEFKKAIWKSQFRNKRKLSVCPLPALRLNNKEMVSNDFDNQSVLSNQNSITSVNSLTSLLKEKMQAFPSMIRKKKKESKDYKIKAFVGILFLIIIFLVGYSYVMYHQKILTRSYFEKAKFMKTERLLTIFNEKGEEILKGSLGTTITPEEPFDCLLDDMLNDGSVCLEWNGLMRLYLNFKAVDRFRCYSIKWQSLSEGIYPTDCYELSKDGYWFGGGLTKNADWPFNVANFDFAPFITGDANVHQFGNAIKRYFINSRGVAIKVKDESPLYISVNNTSKKFCMQAKNDDFAFVNHLTALPELSYDICVEENMKNLHLHMMDKKSCNFTEDDIRIIYSRIEEPFWKIPTLNNTYLDENYIYNYSEAVVDMGYMKLGHILVNEFWQENIGDFSVNSKRFPTLNGSINVLHRRGFKIFLTAQPFISTDSVNFKNAVKNKLLIYERYSERSIPALTRYKSSSSAGVLDVTNNDSILWLVQKLKKVKQDYQIDGFYLDLGTAYNIPHYYQCRTTLNNPDVYGRIFTSNLDETIEYIGVSTAINVPRPPAFLSLPLANSSWEGLRTLVISVLSYGILGYPFILPGSVGGDYFLPVNTKKMLSFSSLSHPPLPAQELYIRWLQIVTFLPAIQFSHLPSEYKSEYVTEITKELMNIRQKTVIPLLKKYVNDSLCDGVSLIRPLWMLDPHDPACLSVNDEFSVGDELIVAPILKKGHLSREVYLPRGVWKDGVDGSLRKGSRWIHSYRVPEDKVAYFVKMPDNTRF